MLGEGKYVYCIISGHEGRRFGPIGIGGRGDEVSTIFYRDLGAVISNVPMTKYVVDKESMIAHEKVIEEVMRDYTVLPVRFQTVAASADEIRSLLRKRYAEFMGLLRRVDNRVELGLKVLWRDMDSIFREIVEQNKDIATLIQKPPAKPSRQSKGGKRAVREAIESALQQKKAAEAEKLLGPLRSIATDFCLNGTHGDDMVMNAAFLVDKGWEREFDNRVEELATRYGDRMKFIYVGPAPPYSFVNVVVKENQGVR